MSEQFTAEWTWVLSTLGTPTAERIELGRLVVTVWTGESYLDPEGGHEVCDAYVPTTDRDYPDGLMLVGRRPLGTRDRAAAKILAVEAAREAARQFGRLDLINTRREAERSK
jgi:hypothetical protein